MENVAYLESIHQCYFSSSFDAFGIFELIVTIASDIISGFSLSVVMFKLNCSKGSAGVYSCLLETSLIPDIYTMVRSSFGPNELSFVAVKTCTDVGVWANCKFTFWPNSSLYFYSHSIC